MPDAGGALATLQASPGLYVVFLAMFGAIAGSFASAAVYRIPRAPDLSLTRPLRSHCGACKAGIAWYDNLPILSWLLLRGRCRSCGVRYGAGYLVHEIGLALLFVAAGQTWAAEEGLLALAVVCVALTALWIAAAVDFGHFILPDGITIGGQIAALPAILLVPELHLWPGRAEAPWGAQIAMQFGLDPGAPDWQLVLASALAGWSIAFLVTQGIGWLFSLLLRQEALGFGDVKYLAAVGAWTGLEGALWTLLIGVFAGSLLGLGNVARMSCLIARRRRARGSGRPRARSAISAGYSLGRLIPFGPPLILGTTLVLLAPSSVHHFLLVTWPQWIAGASPFAQTITTP